MDTDYIGLEHFLDLITFWSPHHHVCSLSLQSFKSQCELLGRSILLGGLQ